MKSFDTIELKAVVAEDFCNYRYPSMFLVTSYCDWKCCKELNIPISVCQNEPLNQQPIKKVSFNTLLNLYKSNNISKAIIIGGLEPMLQFNEIYNLIEFFRHNEIKDDIVIYTGYNKEEIKDKIAKLQTTGKNLIIKYGRFIPNKPKRFDKILGVELASDNQYAERY